MKILKSILLLMLIWAYSFHIFAKSPEIKSLVKSLLPAAQKNNKNSFKTSGCPKYEAQWMAYLLFGQTFTASYNFAKNCDIQGIVNIQSPGPFPINLKLRNFNEFNQLKMQTQIKPNLDEQSVALDGQKGELFGKKTHFFTVNYQMKINMKDGKLLPENEQGSIKFYKDSTYQVIIDSESIGP